MRKRTKSGDNQLALCRIWLAYTRTPYCGEDVGTRYLVARAARHCTCGIFTAGINRHVLRQSTRHHAHLMAHVYEESVVFCMKGANEGVFFALRSRGKK